MATSMRSRRLNGAIRGQSPYSRDQSRRFRGFGGLAGFAAKSVWSDGLTGSTAAVTGKCSTPSSNKPFPMAFIQLFIRYLLVSTRGFKFSPSGMYHFCSAFCSNGKGCIHAISVILSRHLDRLFVAKLPRSRARKLINAKKLKKTRGK
jgi:hypothetical protein